MTNAATADDPTRTVMQHPRLRTVPRSFPGVALHFRTAHSCEAHGGISRERAKRRSDGVAPKLRSLMQEEPRPLDVCHYGERQPHMPDTSHCRIGVPDVVRPIHPDLRFLCTPCGSVPLWSQYPESAVRVDCRRRTASPTATPKVEEIRLFIMRFGRPAAL